MHSQYAARHSGTSCGGAGSERLWLDVGEVAIAVDQVSDIKSRTKWVEFSSGSAATHHLSVTGPTAMSRGEVKRWLDQLHVLFGLCRGAWCGPILLGASHEYLGPVHTTRGLRASAISAKWMKAVNMTSSLS